MQKLEPINIKVDDAWGITQANLQLAEAQLC